MRTEHAAVWIDHQEAKVFHLAKAGPEEERVLALKHHVRHSAVTHEPRLDTFEKHFYRDVAAALADADEVLVVGPGKAKLEFLKYVHAHVHDLDARVVGIETVDHPTDRQIVAYARTYFDKVDRPGPAH